MKNTLLMAILLAITASISAKAETGPLGKLVCKPGEQGVVLHNAADASTKSGQTFTVTAKCGQTVIVAMKSVDMGEYVVAIPETGVVGSVPLGAVEVDARDYEEYRQRTLLQLFTLAAQENGNKLGAKIEIRDGTVSCKNGEQGVSRVNGKLIRQVYGDTDLKTPNTSLACGEWMRAAVLVGIPSPFQYIFIPDGGREGFLPTSAILFGPTLTDDQAVEKLKQVQQSKRSLVITHSAPSRKDIPAIAKDANGAVVSIIMSRHGNPIAQGSGFFVSSAGIVVTNYHVIAIGDSAAVKLPDGVVFPVDGVLAADKTRDLALIKTHGKTFRTLTVGNSDQVQVGEEVVAIGNPLSLESTVSNGIVSGFRTAKNLGGKFLQITTPISPGSSGGPLFNMAGEVVGITTMYLEGGENLNFAIPINDAKLLLPEKDDRFSQNAPLQPLPNESDPSETQARHENTPSNISPQSQTSRTDHDYYQKLFDAGGFTGNLPAYACFSDDSRSGSFFTFRAYAYDADYYNAQAKVQAAAPNPLNPSAWSGGKVGEGELNDEVTPEMQRQFDIMESRQRTAPYVTLLMKGWLESFDSKTQQFFRSGGRMLIEDVFSKGVKTNTLHYFWDGSSWLLKAPPADPNAYTRTSKVFHLSVEPNTMRYVESTSVSVTVGYGETAAGGTDQYGPWSGTCERVPNPK